MYLLVPSQRGFSGIRYPLLQYFQLDANIRNFSGYPI